KTVLVLDKHNKKLWDHALSYNVSSGYGGSDTESATFGLGPCVERKDTIYLNTTTASPESLKYSNQIDISRKDSYLVMKLEPKTGKVLWTADVGGLVSYVSGKFIYCVRSYHADDDEESATYT